MIVQDEGPFLLPGGPKGVLLIHGFTGFPAEMSMLGQYLNERGYTVLAVRLAGHATTAEELERTTAENWLDSARDGYFILKGICTSVAVIGHSLGGLLALQLAAELPMKAVVSLAAPMQIDESRGIANLPSLEASVGMFVDKPHRCLPDVPEVVNRTMKKMPVRGIHEILAMIQRVKGSLPNLKCPLLLLHGTKDHTAKTISAKIIADLAGTGDKEIVWLEGAGHLLPMAEAKQQVFKLTGDFLKKKF